MITGLQRYYLGCPIWSNPVWVGEFYPTDARPREFLRQYAGVFNTVEGNSTFYGLPTTQTVERWRRDTPAGFRFCFKFPRIISHELRLRYSEHETSEFLERMTPLGERLGPLFLQLPPSFGPADLAVLRDYLDRLASGFHYAIEVRHPEFCAKGRAEQDFNRMLHERGMDRVVLDSRALFSAPATDPSTRDAQGKKPRLAVRAIALGKFPLIRLIGHPEVTANEPFLTPWLAKLAEWIGEDRTPFVFTHTPDNHYAPWLAKRLHELLSQRLAGMGELPPWPADTAALQLPLL